MDDTLKLSLRLRCGDDFAMGPGKAQVLEAVDHCGSLSAAGRELGMSYRRLWLLVDVLNRCWVEPLVQTARGGGGGGGAALTELGHRVLVAYRAAERRAVAAAQADDFPLMASWIRPQPLPGSRDAGD